MDLRHLIGMMFGYGGTVIASVSKVPIIRNILKDGNCAGLSFLSVYLDTSVYTATVIYNFKRGNDFYTYGDVAATVVQNLIISILTFWKGPTGKGMPINQILKVVSVVIAYLSIIYILLTPERQYLLIVYSIIVPMRSKGSQIWENIKGKKKGVQSISTSLVSAIGPLLKVYYAIAVTHDMMLLAGALVHFILNGVLLYQLLIFID